MIKISASEFKKKYEEYINSAIENEIIIHKRNRPTVALIDYKTYVDMKQRIEELEDKLLGLLAEKIMENADFVEITPEMFLNVQTSNRKKSP